MPALLINIVDGRWVAEVANTAITYSFEGATLAAQASSVQSFASMMALGSTNAGTYLECGDISVEAVGQQLFGTTDMITYAGRVVYGTVGEEEFLDACLEEAGEALLLAIG